MFDWIDELMDATGCSYETALREYDAAHNPNYDAADYDCDGWDYEIHEYDVYEEV